MSVFVGVLCRNTYARMSACTVNRLSIIEMLRCLHIMSLNMNMHKSPIADMYVCVCVCMSEHHVRMNNCMYPPYVCIQINPNMCLSEPGSWTNPSLPAHPIEQQILSERPVDITTQPPDSCQQLDDDDVDAIMHWLLDECSQPRSGSG